jgi:DNA polymerase V
MRLLSVTQFFKQSQQFKKAGVLLLGLRPKSQRQLSLWKPDELRSDALMQTMDAINAKFGRGTIQFAAAGLKKPWAMKGELRSSRYMTVWNEIPVVRA